MAPWTRFPPVCFRLRSLQKDGYVRYHDLPLETRDGRKIAVEFVSNVYQAGDHNVIQCNIRDITERKRITDAMMFQNVLLTTEQETSLDGILVVGEDGAILSSNQRFATMWGIPEAIIATGSDKLTMQSVLDKLAEPEQFVEKVNYLYTHPSENSHEAVVLKDGRVFERYSAALSGPSEKHYGRVWYFRDITEVRQAVETLQESADRLQKMMQTGRPYGTCRLNSEM